MVVPINNIHNPAAAAGKPGNKTRNIRETKMLFWASAHSDCEVPGMSPHHNTRPIYQGWFRRKITGKPSFWSKKHQKTHQKSCKSSCKTSIDPSSLPHPPWLPPPNHPIHQFDAKLTGHHLAKMKSPWKGFNPQCIHSSWIFQQSSPYIYIYIHHIYISCMCIPSYINIVYKHRV